MFTFFCIAVVWIAGSIIICLITLDVSAYFFPPKIRIVLRPDKIFTAIMLMPEATIYEYNRFVFGQDDIRPAREPAE